ncbi:MAG TPA: hypothetical protein VI854_02315, partial [Acidimicrobiia bacterium]|nr:hypothetical protein [Acidimicrobiia bacterium]
LAAVSLSRDDGDAPPVGSGFVFACDLAATTAVIRFERLPEAPVEVHVDLRGDVAMLPLTGDRARVTSGRSRGHQLFVPSEAGELALLVPLLSRPPHRARLVHPDDGRVILDLALPTLAC